MRAAPAVILAAFGGLSCGGTAATPDATEPAGDAPAPDARALDAGVAPVTAMDWLVQDVCIDAAGAQVLVDPYACPAGDTVRSLRVGESLPYHKHDQPTTVDPDGLQQHDSYPVLDLHGDLLSVNPFESFVGGFDTFAPYAGDGYDIYLARDGWTSASETKSGSAQSGTFFGGGCTPYNGWLFFPTSIVSDTALPTAGSATLPIGGGSWELEGEPDPGTCDVSALLLNSDTTWSYAPQFPFGGAIEANGTIASPVKNLDAIVAVHGFREGSAAHATFEAKGHVEVFYFTKLYGVTRWEVWRPTAQNAPPISDKQCITAGSGTAMYRGETLTISDCRDWSAVTVATAAAPPAFWPVPDLNLLANWHFDAGSLAPWHAAGATITAAQSTLPDDISPPATAGVRYLQVSCAGACTPAAIVYQDLPIAAFTDHGAYSFGATVRADGSGSAAERFAVEIMQVDASGAAIAGTTQTAAQDLTPAPPGRFTGTSIPLTSRFVVATAPVDVAPTAVAVRFAISPQAPVVFDVTDTWLIGPPGQTAAP